MLSFFMIILAIVITNKLTLKDKIWYNIAKNQQN